MKVHYIQHVPFEGLGSIATWLNEHHHSVTVTKVWEKPVFPESGEFDVLIIMGGPMGVHDDTLYTWLPQEKNFIAAAVRDHKKIIGICLGAQLLASVLNAAVYPNRHKEIGWFPVEFGAGFSDWLGADVPSSLNVFHWHGDKFDIPGDGVLHAHSEACGHQLFTVGRNIIGLQFHLEANTESMQSMLESGSGELVESRYVQHAGEIMERASFDQPNKLMSDILERMLGTEADDRQLTETVK